MFKMMCHSIFTLAATVLLLLAMRYPCLAQNREVLFENNFEKAELDKLPEGFDVLDGTFLVKEAEGNRFLELPGAPLDTYAVLFGPKEQDAIEVSARIYGTAKGRRSPTFAVGLAGSSGYKLQVSPGKRVIELYRSDTFKTAVPYVWDSGQWTRLRLRCRKTSAGWMIEGKAWTEGRNEPAAWTISAEDSETLNPGPATLFGSPLSGTSIRFDDVVVSRLSK